LTKEKESQRAQIKELKLKAQMQESELERSVQDFRQRLVSKDKKIEDMTNLLSKSYQSLNSSIDKIRIASKTSESQQYSKKAKEGSAYYSSVPSYLKASKRGLCFSWVFLNFF
jgi:hypothetical protein